MPSLFSGEKGLGPFVDDLIVVLASRYGAPIDVTPPFTSSQQDAWDRVAAAVQHNLQSAMLTPEERQEALHIEPHRFNASVCFSRASYVLWRARRQQQSVASRFDITKHSIRKEIEEIYEAARHNLPSIMSGDNEDDDADELEALTVVHTKTEEQVERDRHLAEIDDEFMKRVQELQVQYFEQHRRWIEVDQSVFDKPKQTQEGRSSNFCIENINRKNLEDVTSEELAVVFDALDISEHKQSFRRTNGTVLKALRRDELRDRFRNDMEAADLLWAWVKERRDSDVSSNHSNSKSSTPVKSKAPVDATRQQVDAMFQMFRQMNGAPAARQPAYHDPLASLRASINPNRPPRPSAVGYDDDDAYEAAAGNAVLPEDGDDAMYMAKVEAAVKLDPRRGNVASSQPTAAPKPTASSQPPPPPARSNRWQVMEYDDDDDDDDE